MRKRFFFLLLFISSGLFGCGQKGGLYLPATPEVQKEVHLDRTTAVPNQTVSHRQHSVTRGQRKQ